MKNILVVNVNWLGDIVFSAPVFQAIKDTYPQSRVSALALPRVVGILKQVPYVDEIIVYDEKGHDRSLWGKLKLIAHLRSKDFDAVFLLHGSWTRALLVFLAGIPIRVGYDRKKRGWLLTHRVVMDEGVVHRSDLYLKVLEPLGIAVKNRQTCLEVDQEAVRRVKDMLTGFQIHEGDFCVVVHIGGNWNLKRWSVENFAKLFDALTRDFNAKVVVCGGEDDLALAQEVSALAARKPVVLAGKTNLGELVALLQRASVVISGDSGPLHLANSVGTSVIGLFGPTHPSVTGPRGSGKSMVIRHEMGCNIKPCYHLKCPDNVCMKAITVNHVIQKIREFAY